MHQVVAPKYGITVIFLFSTLQQFDDSHTDYILPYSKLIHSLTVNQYFIKFSVMII